MRRTHHRRHFHTDRIVRNRRARYLREHEASWRGRLLAANHDEWLAVRLSHGYLADRDPWDCGRHCLLCHWDKFVEPRRARENREWRHEWGV